MTLYPHKINPGSSICQVCGQVPHTWSIFPREIPDIPTEEPCLVRAIQELQENNKRLRAALSNLTSALSAQDIYVGDLP